VQVLTTLKPQGIIDGEHRRVREGVAGAHAPNVRSFLRNAPEHGRLRPLGQAEPPMRQIDPRVLLEGDAPIIRLKSDFGAPDTFPRGVADEHRPAMATAADERTVELLHVVDVNDDITDIQVVP
jgi:hypothetical protein